MHYVQQVKLCEKLSFWQRARGLTLCGVNQLAFVTGIAVDFLIQWKWMRT